VIATKWYQRAVAGTALVFLAASLPAFVACRKKPKPPAPAAAQALPSQPSSTPATAVQPPPAAPPASAPPQPASPTEPVVLPRDPFHPPFPYEIVKDLEDPLLYPPPVHSLVKLRSITWTDEYHLAGIAKWDPGIPGMGPTGMYAPGDKLLGQGVFGVVGQARKEYETMSPRPPFNEYIAELQKEESQNVKRYWLTFEVSDLTRSSVTVLRNVAEKAEGFPEGRMLDEYHEQLTLAVRPQEADRQAYEERIRFTMTMRGGGEQ